jgi:hypothetical protein
VSLRFFVYDSTIAGAISALLAWIVGLPLPTQGLFPAATRSLLLAACLAVGLSFVDARWNGSLHPASSAIQRFSTAGLVAGVGGFLAGILRHLLVTGSPLIAWLAAGLLTGLFVGGSLGLFDWLLCACTGQDSPGSRNRMVLSLTAGVAGGIVGGLLALLVHTLLQQAAFSKPVERLWLPTVAASMVFGAAVALMISLLQVWRREAWLLIEEGTQAGRELLLSRPLLTIGRGEECDLTLNGDAGIQKVHARLFRQESQFIVSDAGTAGGTRVNGERLIGPRVLHDGDRIQIGDHVLFFRNAETRST